MMRYLLIAFLCIAFAAKAQAQIKHYPDPVYKKLNAGDNHPMDDMLELAKQGDARAQFIMGDLYAKGKGGVEKNLSDARHWFEQAAIHGNGHGLIRLAALAKRENHPIEAWLWYSLAIKTFDRSEEQKYAIHARDELMEKSKLTRENISIGRKSMDAWEDARDKQLYAERQAARTAAPEQPVKQPPTTGIIRHDQD